LPQRGIYPTGSYATQGQESINKQNGILSYTIPITSLPLGRGGMTVPINLTYSSALSDTVSYAGYTQGEPNHTGEFAYAASSGAGGWNFAGFNYGLYEVAPESIPTCTPLPAPPFQLGVLMPDGAHITG
jgi:hypothetical protein